MKVVTTYEAKTHLSRIIDAVIAGEEVVVCRRKKPVVKISAYTEPVSKRTVGALPGLVTRMTDTFNEPLEDWDNALLPNPEEENHGRPA